MPAGGSAGVADDVRGSPGGSASPPFGGFALSSDAYFVLPATTDQQFLFRCCEGALPILWARYLGGGVCEQRPRATVAFYKESRISHRDRRHRGSGRKHSRIRAFHIDNHRHALTAQLPEQSRFDARRDFDDAVDLHLVHHLRIAMQHGDQLALGHGHVDADHRTECLRGGAEHTPQPVQPCRMRNTGRQHGVRVLLAYLSEESRGVGQ